MHFEQTVDCDTVSTYRVFSVQLVTVKELEALHKAYFRYADHTFAIFNHEAEADEFLTKLNCLHPSLTFTFENEKGKCLPFLDVYVEKTDVGLETSVYRKPTFTGSICVGSPLVLSNVKQV